MNDYKILIIEHSSISDLMLEALKPLGSVVLLYGPEGLREALDNDQFDLVITDAFFLDKYVEHDLTNDTGEYKLNYIIDTIREVDSNRVRIAVFTNFSPHLLTEYQDDLSRADYLWDKSSCLLDFVCWQVTQIKNRISKKYPTFGLVHALEKLLHDNKQLPWSTEMTRIIKSYWSRSNEHDQFNSAKPHLLSISHKSKIFVEFEPILNLLISGELFNVATTPSTWGHLRHTLNVFWLGYYMLNCGFIDYVRFAKAIDPDFTSTTSDQNLIIEFVNKAWFTASIFHDVGYLGEKIHALNKSFNSISKCYRSDLFTINNAFDFKKFTSENEKNIHTLQSFIGQQVNQYYYEMVKHMESTNTIDHGFLSAVTLLKQCDKSMPPSVLGAAAEACAIHSSVCKHFRKLDTKIDFATHPLLCLLLLCDQLEVWDRQTNTETLFSSSKIECGELRHLSFKHSDNLLCGTINYLPLYYLSPVDAAVEEIYSNLLTVLDSNVIPILRLINFNPVIIKHITINFLLNGRTELTSWNSFD